MSYKSPLEGYETAEPLPEGFSADGKSLVNTLGPLSKAYDVFQPPIKTQNNGFDIHIYYMQTVASEAKYARELHERVRREFPELRIYRFWDKPVGPHPVAMFEVNVFTPHQFGAFVAWLVHNRGPLSVLIHPNTGDALRDHTESATWIGRPYPLYTEMLKGH